MMVRYTWDGEVMRPLPFFRKHLSETCKVGSVYELDEVEPRSAVSHRHYFAVINDAWANLPEGVRDRWTSPNELRLWALTFTGWRTTREFPARSEAEAIRVMKYLLGDERYSRVEVDPATKTVTQYIPRSQSEPEMSRTDFQKSKDDVFRVLAQKLGVDVGTLTANAGTAA